MSTRPRSKPSCGSHPGVAQVAVVGVPDHRMGEVGLAVVVPAADADASQLARPTAGLSPTSSWPTSRCRVGWRSSTSLPTNASGKVLKRELRARFGA